MIAAVLIGASGFTHIAQLWFVPLSEPALLRALLGAVYLFISIGLLGLSQTSLILGVIVPVGTTFYLAYAKGISGGELSWLTYSQALLDVLSSGYCAWLLYRFRPRRR